MACNHLVSLLYDLVIVFVMFVASGVVVEVVVLVVVMNQVLVLHETRVASGR